MKILSLFDGISCARVALEKVGIEVESYHASEVDPYAIKISRKNYPDIIQMGDIKDVKFIGGSASFCDLLIGGSPCQDLSIAKQGRKGLEGSRSGLFWEYVRILKITKPKWFVLENVASMPKEAKQVITEALGVEPIMINAALVSGQNRKRLFWTNIPNVVLPVDRGIFLKDILEDGSTTDLKAYAITATYAKKNERDYLKKGSGQMIQIGDIGTKNVQSQRVYSPEGKSVALQANGGGMGAKTGLYLIEKAEKGTSFDYYNNKIVPNGKAKVIGTNPQCITAVAGQIINDGSLLRKLTPIECERLQGLPDNYTQGCSNTQRYKMLGNAFNVEVVAHILKNLK